MKSELKPVTAYCWSCHFEYHRHKTETVAQRCIDSYKPPHEKKWTKEKLFQLLHDHQIKKIPAKELAKAHGVGRGRIYSLLNNARWRKGREINDKNSGCKGISTA